MEGLYKLPKEMLIKIIESGFSVDNLNKKECLDMKKKCARRISKLRNEEMKEHLRNNLPNFIWKKKISEEKEKEIKEYIDLIKISLWEERRGNVEVLLYTKDRFELSFTLQEEHFWLNSDQYIGMYDSKRKRMENNYYKCLSEENSLFFFHGLIMNVVTAECLNNVFEKKFHYP